MRLQPAERPVQRFPQLGALTAVADPGEGVERIDHGGVGGVVRLVLGDSAGPSVDGELPAQVGQDAGALRGVGPVAYRTYARSVTNQSSAAVSSAGFSTGSSWPASTIRTSASG